MPLTQTFSNLGSAQDSFPALFKRAAVALEQWIDEGPLEVSIVPHVFMASPKS